MAGSLRSALRAVWLQESTNLFKGSRGRFPAFFTLLFNPCRLELDSLPWPRHGSPKMCVRMKRRCTTRLLVLDSKPPSHASPKMWKTMMSPWSPWSRNPRRLEVPSTPSSPSCQRVCQFHPTSGPIRAMSSSSVSPWRISMSRR